MASWEPAFACRERSPARVEGHTAVKAAVDSGGQIKALKGSFKWDSLEDGWHSRLHKSTMKRVAVSLGQVLKSTMDEVRLNK